MMNTRMRAFRAALSIISCVATLPATAAPFTPGNIVVYRAGNGTGTLVATGNPVFLDEYTTAGTLVQSIALPTAAAGTQKALLASGTATSDGLLTRSADGACLVAPGYARDLGQAGGNLTSGTVGTGGPPIPRVVARVNAAGIIDSSTALTDAAPGSNFRGAASTDCNSIWVSGTTGSGTAGGGVRYTTLGSTTSSDLTSANFANTRAVAIYNGQLYMSASVTALRGVASLGSATPTSALAASDIRVLPGLSNTTSPGSYAFFLADLDPAVPGVDTLYIADEGIGLTKFSLVGSTWVASGVIGTAADVYRGVTGVVNGTTVTLFATRRTASATAPGGELVTITDTSGPAGTLTGTPTVIAAAGTNTIFRGVALAPYLTVTASAGGNGTIDPAGTLVVAANSSRSFTVIPDAGYTAVVGGTCGGTLSGATFTTDPIAASCTVTASFTQIPTYVVTPSAGAHGNITPSTPRTLLAGGTTSFVVTPDPGYAASVGGTCTGTFDGTTFTTAPANADCTVEASFVLVTFNVTATSDANGTIAPAGTQAEPRGTAATFAVTAAHGFTATVGGSCGGSLANGTYTTAPIVADCTVAASFTPLAHFSVTTASTGNGTATPAAPQDVISGDTASITIAPAPGYHFAVRGSCGGTISGNTYTTAPVLGDCSIAVTFARKIVLFVGNSFTHGRVDPVLSYNAANVSDLTFAMWLVNPLGSNDDEPHPWGGIPGIFKKLTDQAGLDYDVSISARSAATLRGQYLDSNPANWDMRGNVASQRWDAVVLQDLSDEPLPAGRGANANLPFFNTYVDKFEAWVHAGNAETFTETQLFGGTSAACQATTGDSASQCDRPWTIAPANGNADPATQVFLYETWARPDMIAPDGTDVNGTFYTQAEGLEAMTADFHAAYFGRAAANPRIEDVSPVGDAFLRAVQDGIAVRDPYIPDPTKIDLWHTDFMHPSKYGSYLSALVHYATITGLNPMALGAGEQAAADLGISPDIAVKLQRVARETVMPDTTAPTSTASLSPPPNAQGWSRSTVTVTLTAADDAAGWGLDGITYSLSGAQSGSGTLASGGSIAITAEGQTTVTYFARDAAGNAEAPHLLVVKIDATAPVFHVPASLAVDATSPSGATMTFSATATDNSGATPAVTCTPASGGLFAIGADAVTCTASDAAGNTASASFVVTVRGAAEQTARLAAAILALRGVNVSTQSITALTNYLQSALNKPRDQVLFCATLKLFTLELGLLSGRAIPAAQAAPLITSANQIRVVEGCR